MSKAQGLPLNTIVLAAMAVLVLLLIVGFTVGGLGKLFSGTGQQISQTKLQSAQTTCQQLCTNLKNEAAMGSLTEDKAKNSEYATQIFYFGSGDTLKEYHCWQNPIDVQCVITFKEWDPGSGKWKYCKCLGKGSSYTCTCTT